MLGFAYTLGLFVSIFYYVDWVTQFEMSDTAHMFAGGVAPMLWFFGMVLLYAYWREPYWEKRRRDKQVTQWALFKVHLPEKEFGIILAKVNKELKMTNLEMKDVEVNFHDRTITVGDLRIEIESLSSYVPNYNIRITDRDGYSRIKIRGLPRDAVQLVIPRLEYQWDDMSGGI
jgi:hypothetical protein